MKTKFFNYLLMGAFAMMSSVAFISCSSDDDNGGGNGVPTDEYGVYTQGKKLATHEGWMGRTTFNYTDNRLSKVNSSYGTFTYKWSKGKVEQINDQNETVQTYTIKNGLVTEIIPADRGWGAPEDEKISFSYNGNRQLIKQTNQWGPTNLTWNSGRITKATIQDGDYVWVETFEYEKTCQQGYYPPTDYQNCIWPDGNINYLCYAHPELFGLRMNSLPSKVKDTEGYVTKYAYTLNEEGCVIECSVRNDYTNNTFTYTWE